MSFSIAKRSSLQKRFSKFMTKKFQEIDSWGLLYKTLKGFAIVIYLHPSVTIVCRAGAYLSGAPSRDSTLKVDFKP